MQMLNSRHDNRGFTIIELMVVLALVGVMAAIAAPSFSNMIKTTRIKGVASDLHMSLLKARSEAVKRNDSVAVAAVGGNWQSGWHIDDTAGLAACLADSPDFDLCLENRSAAEGVTITTKPGCGGVAAITDVTYTRSGRIQGLTTANRPCFEISADNTDKKRCVTVEVSGIPAVRQQSCS